MGQNLDKRFNLVENVWEDAPCPVVFFMHRNDYAKADGMDEIKEALLKSRVIEISNVSKVDSGFVFRMFIKGHIVNCRLNTQYCNLAITSVYVAKKNAKIEFIESKRKLISVEEYGVIFSIYDNDTRERLIEPERKANEMKRQFATDFPDSMPKAGYDMLAKYICSDAKIETKVSEPTYFEEKFLKTVSDFAKIEYQLEQADIEQLYSLTYISRQSVKVGGDNSQKYIYEFICPDFDSENYPPNTEVFIVCENSNYGGNRKLFGSIVNVEDVPEMEDFKKVTITFKNQFGEEELPLSGGEIKRNANSCQKNVRDRVVEAFKKKTVKADYMYETFNNPDKFKTRGFDESIDMQEIFDDMKARGSMSNERQRLAIEKGVKTKDIALVLGPPGTGKTTVIVEWVIHFIKNKKRVLISSKNNKAVDNALERIIKNQQDEEFLEKHPEFRNLGMLRIGNVDKVQMGVRNYLPENQHAAIRDRILGATSEWDKKIEHDKTAVTDAIRKLEEQCNNVAAFFGIENRLKEFYSQLKKEWISVLQLDAEICKLEKLHFQMVEDAAAKRIYLDEENKKNFFVRLLHSFATRIIKKELSELIDKIENKNPVRYNMCVREYNSAIQRIKAIVTEREFGSLKKSCADGRAYLNTVLNFDICPELPFEKIVYSFSKDRAGIGTFERKIRELDSRIKTIDETMKEWEGEISDKNNNVLSSILINKASVVGATCIGINSNSRFQNVDFDVAIIDEAGQIQIHDAIVPMSRAKKTLMLGDYLQIPPSVNEKMLEKCIVEHCDVSLLEQSFFEYIYNRPGFPKENTVMLDTQFRMPSEVADILSYQFYKGEYKSFETKKNLPSLFPELFNSPLVVLDTSDSRMRRERSDGVNKYNPYEAQMIVKILEKLGFGSGELAIDVSDIGIIAPLKRQKIEIQMAVKSRFPFLSKSVIEGMIATLDSFQGQERELIIYSCTRSNRWNKIGFLNELRRLNVALSRCQKQIVIIGDFDFLTTCTDDPHEEEVNYDTAEELDENEWMDEFEDNDDDDGDDIGIGIGVQTAEPEESDEQKKLALTKTTKRFSEFMKYLLEQVKAGKGHYIKSCDFGE